GSGIVCVGVEQDDTGNPAVKIYDPLANEPTPLTVPEAQLCRCWRGDLVLIKRVYGLTSSDQPFRLRWFLPELARQRHLFVDVAVAAVLLNILGLPTPLLFHPLIATAPVHHTSH